MADLTRIPGLQRRIATTRARLGRLAIVRAFWPLLLFVALFALFVLAGLHASLSPAPAALVTLFGLVGTLVLALRGMARYRAPERAAALDALDRQSDYRPIASLADRPVSPDPDGRALWQAHGARLAEIAASLRPPRFSEAWRRLDPAFLRLVLPLALIGTLAATWSDAPGRLERLLKPDIGALVGADSLQVEAWITPPDYSGRAPVFLTADMNVVRVPAGSEVTVRAIGRSAPLLRLESDAGLTRTRLQETPDGAYESRAALTADTALSVRWWGERAAWEIRTEPDAPPSARYVEAPSMTTGDELAFTWAVADDYGVERLELAMRLVDPHPAAPDEEARVRVDMVQVAPRRAEEAVELDLTRHKWAGLQVEGRLVATDGAGQEGESETLTFRVPEKLFLQPLARAAQEARVTVLREPRDYGARDIARQALRDGALYTDATARLAEAPEDIQRAAIMLDALTYKGERFIDDGSIYFGLRRAHGILQAAVDKPGAEAVEPLLWAVALKAEYGSAADALRALLAAKRALEQALRDGASEDEIRRLMEAFKEAANNYLAAKMAEAFANGLPEAPAGDGQQQGPGLGGQDFEDMLRALEDLAETGAADQARQLLSDITNMLQNLEFQRGQSGEGGFQMPGAGGQGEDGEASEDERQLSEAIERLSELLREQRELNDDTLAEQRGEAQQPGQQPGQGQQGNQGEGQTGEGQSGQGNDGMGAQPGPDGQPGAGSGEEGEGRGGYGRLADRQGELGDRLDELRRGGGLTGEDGEGAFAGEALDEAGRQALAEALQAIRRAERSLEEGNGRRAGRFQEDATEELRDLAEALAGELDDLRAERLGEEGGSQEAGRDPFGRMTGGYDYTGDVQIPDEADRQRAKDILNELRERYGRAQDEDEKRYLERLLDRF